jgi:hypothetical protein
MTESTQQPVAIELFGGPMDGNKLRTTLPELLFRSDVPGHQHMAHSYTRQEEKYVWQGLRELQPNERAVALRVGERKGDAS